MQQTNSNRFNTFLNEITDHATHFGLVERFDFNTVGIKPTADFRTQIARHESRRGLDSEIIKIVLTLVTNLDNVPKAASGYQARAASAPLNQGICKKGGRVNDPHHVSRD